VRAHWFKYTGRPGGFGHGDLWQVSIEPVVDFNGDGIVDCVDMYIMVGHWHTDEPSSENVVIHVPTRILPFPVPRQTNNNTISRIRCVVYLLLVSHPRPH
jgi:hypothetical protein